MPIFYEFSIMKIGENQFVFIRRSSIKLAIF